MSKISGTGSHNSFVDGAVLYTDRLILRPWSEGDAESLFELARDPEVGPRAAWPPHESVEQSRQVIRDVLAGPESYAVCLRTAQRDASAAEGCACDATAFREVAAAPLIGACGLKFGDACCHASGDDECEIGYWIGRAFWGRGYMTEAASALVDRALTELGMSAVWADRFDFNDASGRVLEKCGFDYVRTEDLDVPLLKGRRRILVYRCGKRA